MIILVKFIAWLYYSLLILVPLALYPHSSEIFEFNKIIVVYLFTIFIMFFWSIRMVYEKRFIFKNSKLDVPILIFLGLLTITTVFSIDPHTSFFGYYTRFHGGLLSYITYALLYWGFVSNLNKEHSIKAIHSLIIGSILVSIYGILQHFGIDKDLWIQDVQLRIFSTLGQPNWLAAWIVALIPLSWNYIHQKESLKHFSIKNIFFGNYWISLSVFFVFYLVLSYTRSRSGFIALLTAGVAYFSIVIFQHFKENNLPILIKKLAIPTLIILTYSLVAGTVYTPSLNQMFRQNSVQTEQIVDQVTDQAATDSTAAPTVSFESSEIRLIVWRGAIDVWKHNPILGTGPETFAYSYYQHRPAEHNLVSEWDFLYNKAHNEYLNQLATTGVAGTIGYLIFHLGVILLLINNFKRDNSENKYLHLAMLSGFFSIIVTNFAGFSVVPVALLMFLFPAVSVSVLKDQPEDLLKKAELDQTQKIIIGVSVVIALFLMTKTVNYWRADLFYARAQLLNNTRNFQSAHDEINEAIRLRSNEHIYWQTLAESEAGMAVLLLEINEDMSMQVARSAYENLRKAEIMNPHDVNNLRKQASTLLRLSFVDPGYLAISEQTIVKAVNLAPTEAKLIYNLGVIQLRQGKYDEGIENLEKAIKLRPVYKDAYYALALAFIETGQDNDARKNLIFILENLDPDDQSSLEELEKLNGAETTTSTDS